MVSARMDPPTRPEPPYAAAEPIPWRCEPELPLRLREDLRRAAAAAVVGVDFDAIAVRLRAAIAPNVTSRAGANHHPHGTPAPGRRP